ncbi:vomeronasal type-2 receptor 26 [Xenopus laevis]|uniref:Vomeronasal type-2 receptor 26 n=1 Tax=Xenopus laevis TaxID=8355 RepID=A0A8J1KQZ7_XENLA|nr:vomeronasal type-2 receptor 26 [Xenopus laevis]
MKFQLNGSFSLLIEEGEIPDFEQFFYSFSPNDYPNNALIASTWQDMVGCFSNDIPSLPGAIPDETVKTCTGNETLSDADLSVYGNHNYRITYRVYTAVYALAHALHNLYSAQPPANHWDKLESLKRNVKPWQINRFVRNVTFATFPNVTHSFNKYGDPPAQFDIINWLFIPGHEIVTTTVGDFNASDHKILFYIKSISDLWGSQFNMALRLKSRYNPIKFTLSQNMLHDPAEDKIQSPLSLCNEPCALGHRKSKKEGVPSCCYDCVPCVDGEMSNTTDAPSCFKCPGYEMSNKNRTGCVPKMINYLSYEDTLGASLASTALMLFITTSAVQGIFVKYWDTPIVKANNQSLSCLLLISLMLCFLCTLLFIGRPTPICCLLRQVTFGIVFTISVSSVLAKTLTVIIAFNATKPGSKLKKYVGYKVAFVLVTICSLGSSGICFVWMTFDPPFLEASMFSQRDIIILMCNEGSVTFFFCIIGYIGTLALLSFIAAFLAKDFPDRFNEAKNITFSMLVFCSVWVTFVPAYLSSKGSRMVAVEIFAILSSSAGLLGCIFAPKCYIIFLRPELNTRVAVV